MEKEQRRRKIIARGTDRMALITGRIQSLDPDPFSKSSSFSNPRRDNPPTQHARSSSEPVFPEDHHHHHHHDVDDVPDTVTSNDIVDEVPKRDDSRRIVSPKVQKVVEKREVAQSTLAPDSPNKSWVDLFSSVTPNEINFSIISSEDTRVICAVALAVMVVLSHVTLPHDKVVRPKSLITYRPLFVVVLTDVFIVGVRLAPFAQIRREDKKSSIEEDGDNWGGAFKLLEFGLVLHQTIRAVFIDCSFYLVIVICGLSLL